MNSIQKITSFNEADFDAKRIAYYQHYFTEYYHDAFRPNQGTEVILKTLKKYASSGAWLDIGAGPATLFWSLMLEGVTRLDCTELYVEGLKVLDDFMRSDVVPQCYQDVIDMYNINPSHLDAMRHMPRQYFLYDALKQWPAEVASGAYDLVTAYGVFGLTTTPAAYKKCFMYVQSALKPGGVVLGANWIRSQKFIDEGNTDNRFMDPHLVEQAAQEYRYETLHVSHETIEGDPNYDGVIVWVLRR